MTDRIGWLTVVLRRDLRDDDVQSLIDAIQLLNGVGKVHKGVVTHEMTIAMSRARLELRDHLWRLLDD